MTSIRTAEKQKEGWNGMQERAGSEDKVNGHSLT